jgi:hypothetical protein
MNIFSKKCRSFGISPQQVKTVREKDDSEETHEWDKLNLARGFLEERGIKNMKPLIVVKRGK